MITVENRAGADHVGPGFRAGGDGGAVGDVQDAGIGAERAETINGGIKTVELLLGLMADGGGGENFGRGEMREGADEREALAPGELPGETVGVFREDAEAIHAGVNFELDGDIFFAEFGGRGFVSV